MNRIRLVVRIACAQLLRHKALSVLNVMILTSSFVFISIVLGVLFGAYSYFFAHVPPHPERIATINFYDLSASRHLESNDFKKKYPEIEYFAPNSSFPSIVSASGIFVRANIEVYSEDRFRITPSQMIHRTKKLEDGKCLLGIQVFRSLHLPTHIQIASRTYEVADVIYNQRYANAVFLNNTDYLNHQSFIHSYALMLREDKLEHFSELIHQIKTDSKTEELRSHLDYSEAYSNESKIFPELVRIAVLLIIAVLTYGLVSLLQVILARAQAEAVYYLILIKLGAKRGFLYFLEVAKLGLFVTAAFGLSVPILYGLKTSIEQNTTLYLDFSLPMIAVSLGLSIAFVLSCSGFIVHRLICQFQRRER